MSILKDYHKIINLEEELASAVREVRDYPAGERDVLPYMLVGKDSKENYLSGQQCFIRLKEGSYEGESGAMYLVTKTQGLSLSTEEEGYLDWLLRDSSLSSYYVTRSAEEYLGEGVFIVRCDIPANLVMVCASLVRVLWEYPAQIHHWHGLVVEGVEPLQAAFFSCFMSGRGRDMILNSYAVDEGHQAFSRTNSLKALRSASRGVFPYEEGLLSESSGYREVTLTFGMDGTLLYDVLSKLVSEEGKVKGAFGECAHKRHPGLHAQIAKQLRILNKEGSE